MVLALECDRLGAGLWERIWSEGAFRPDCSYCILMSRRWLWWHLPPENFRDLTRLFRSSFPPFFTFWTLFQRYTFSLWGYLKASFFFWFIIVVNIKHNETCAFVVFDVIQKAGEAWAATDHPVLMSIGWEVALKRTNWYQWQYLGDFFRKSLRGEKVFVCDMFKTDSWLPLKWSNLGNSNKEQMDKGGKLAIVKSLKAEVSSVIPSSLLRRRVDGWSWCKPNDNHRKCWCGKYKL